MYKDEGRVDIKINKKEEKHGEYNMWSISSSIDSKEMDDQVKRVRTLPIPSNFFLVGLQHKNTLPTEEGKCEPMMTDLAMPCDLSVDFWEDALCNMDDKTDGKK